MSGYSVTEEKFLPVVSSNETTRNDTIVSLESFYQYGRKPIVAAKRKFGYSPYDLVSVLQKDIRRGNEYQALFWVAKLESLGKKKIKETWNRLKVIASEDIGLANPHMPVIIETLEKQYFDARRRRNDSFRLFLTNAVLNLCRSKKSRITDDLLNIVYGEIQNEDKKLPLPDYAFDDHTSKGKRMGRGIDYFFEEAAKLNNEAFENPYKEKTKEILKKYGKLKPEFRKKKTETKAGNSKTKRVDENLGVFIAPEVTESA